MGNPMNFVRNLVLILNRSIVYILESLKTKGYEKSVFDLLSRIHL